MSPKAQQLFEGLKSGPLEYAALVAMDQSYWDAMIELQDAKLVKSERIPASVIAVHQFVLSAKGKRERDGIPDDPEQVTRTSESRGS